MSFNPCTCAACGIVFGISPSYEAILRRSGKDFYCPNGHSLSFGESEADKLRRERDRLKQQASRLLDAASEQREIANLERRRAAAARGQVTKLKKRAAAGVCPCCNRTFSDLARHMAGQHPEFISQPDEASHVH